MYCHLVAQPRNSNQLILSNELLFFYSLFIFSTYSVFHHYRSNLTLCFPAADAALSLKAFAFIAVLWHFSVLVLPLFLSVYGVQWSALSAPQWVNCSLAELATAPRDTPLFTSVCVDKCKWVCLLPLRSVGRLITFHCVWLTLLSL